MLIPLAGLLSRHPLKITGVLHVGAHLGEEAEAYAQAGIAHVWWCEANPKLITQLRASVKRYDNYVICAAVSDVDGDVRKFNVTNNGESSSLLELGTHRRTYPNIHVSDIIEVETSTIDQLCIDHDITGANFLNLDIQGAELLALRGASTFLAGVDGLYSEVNEEDVYEGCARVSELDDFLAPYGLARVETVMEANAGWGDGLWVKVP